MRAVFASLRGVLVAVSAVFALAAGNFPGSDWPTPYLAAAEPPMPVRYRAGDLVVVICRADLKVENSVIDVVDEGLMLGVDRVDGDWLWVTNNKSGWLKRSNVILAEQAVELFSAALRRNSTDARLYARRGLARALNKDYAGALKDCNEALRLKPTEAVYYGDRGCIHLALGDADRAIADFKQEASLIDSEDESKRAIRLEWLDQRIADAQAMKANDTAVTLGNAQ